MLRKRFVLLLLILLLVAPAARAGSGAAAAVTPRASLVSVYRESIAHRVRVTRILTEVLLGLLERALEDPSAAGAGR